MIGLTDNIEPASETYAGYAWEYLRRNSDYIRDYDRVSATKNLRSATDAHIICYESEEDELAHKWGLECFASPKSRALDALVIWRRNIFPSVLPVHYHDEGERSSIQSFFKLFDLDCYKQHYIKSDGTRISVIKSEKFWLQILGKPDVLETDNSPFSVLIEGKEGSCRRIDALRQLNSLCLNGAQNFKLLGRHKAFSKMKNSLIAYDIHSNGGSYRDVAIALFGADIVRADWDSTGGFLKARTIRAFKFGNRMVKQDYKKLLSKKVI